MWLIVLATSIWMAVDSSQLGYDKRDIGGLAGMGPAGWLLSGLLLWIVAFPIYLLKRPQLKAAGLARRLRAQAGHCALPPSPYGRYAPPASHPRHAAGTAPTGYAQASGNPYGGSSPQQAAPGPGRAPYAPPAPPQPSAYWQNAPVPEPGGSVFRVADEIVKLGALRDRGLLTDAEFQERKAQLLNA